jgi:hypothetical protein
MGAFYLGSGKRKSQTFWFAGHSAADRAASLWADAPPS